MKPDTPIREQESDEDDFDVRDAAQIQSRVAGSSGWDDAEMSEYDDYDFQMAQRRESLGSESQSPGGSMHDD